MTVDLISTKNGRDSKYELAKVAAILLIILSHVAHQSSVDAFAFNTDAIIKAISVYLGQIGNGVFIISTCYFLTKGITAKKWIKLYLQTIFYSIVFLAYFSFFQPEAVSLKTIVKSFFPIAFENNWFISAYLIFVLLVPVLQVIREHLKTKQYFYLTICFFMLYTVAPTFIGNRYFSSRLFGFITVYLITTLLKDVDFIRFVKTWQLCMLSIIGCCIVVAFIITVNYIGQYIGIIYGKTFFWQSYSSLPLLVVNFSVFEILRRSKSWHNKFINCLSKSSLGIYLIHNNFLIVECKKINDWFKCFDGMFIVHRYILITVIVFVVSLLLDKTRELFFAKIDNILTDWFLSKILYPIKHRIDAIF
ncbi:acyltransferase family protein [Lacrimispora saccharolytica]|uniref:acyltransferase family protein n=1 Tax=Lacrimispora saccharolytica TaxID=84030 RepID=UPI00265C992D|nr:acyltransferase family protein [Lacrimispora saccharolytica]MCF2657186.1 acyltransferase family protein [Lacrimispora saccharolytica]